MKLLHLGLGMPNDLGARCAIASLLSVGLLGIANSRVEARETSVRKTAAVETQRPTETGTRVKDFNRPAITLQEWEANLEHAKLLTQNAPVSVTRVQVNRVESGLDIVLETADGKPPQVHATKFRAEGKSLIADIPNAVLALPNAQEFSADNPTSEIASVRVTQTDASTIRVSVVGTTALPTSDVTLKVGGLAYSLNPEGEIPEEELVVTGAGQGGYRVPDAVTATKTDTPLRDIPQSIQVIPQQVIEDQKVTRIFDALRNVSSVTKEGSYGDATDAYRIRGFVTFDSLRNGFRIQDPIINPTNLERIEVLKGPASVLYGQFEPGGIVNFVTKQPLDRPYYAADFTVGNYDYYRPSIDLSGPLTTDKKLLYRLNAAYETTGDFVDFVDSKTFAIAPALTYKFNENTTLTLEYEYINLDRVYNDGLPPNPIVFQLPISRFLGEPDINRLRQEANNLYVTLNHQFSDNLQLRTGFAAYFADTKVRSIRPDAIDVDGRTVLRRFVPEDNLIYSGYTVQADLIGKFNTGSIKHQVLLGFAWDQSNYSDPGYFQGEGTPLDIFNPVYGAPQPNDFPGSAFKENRDTFGIYLQDQVTLLPNLKLLLGGRVDFIHRKSFSQDLDSAGNPSDDATRGRFYDNPFTPRAGIVYQPIEPISLYFSYAQSFNPSSSRTVDNQPLPPERGTQYEVGLKADLIKDRLSATFAAYEITKQNVATTDPNNSDFSIAAGEVKSRGLEFDISGEILPGWKVIASYFVNDAFISKDNSLPVGDSLVNAPRHGGSLWTSYEFQDGGLKGFGIGAGLFYSGDREAELPNTFEIPSYVRADAAIYYKRNNWRVGLNFKNLTGTRYYESQGYFLRPGAPFSVLGSISINF